MRGHAFQSHHKARRTRHPMSDVQDSSKETLKHYLDEFGPVDMRRRGTDEGPRRFEEGGYPKDSRVAKAFELAHDIRKFEIDLLWKRAGYFWLLLAALATSLGIVVSSGRTGFEHRDEIALVISCAGSVVALGWWLANHASRQWQKNWEYQVDVLEDAVVGPLYKTRLRAANDPQQHGSVSAIGVWLASYFFILFALSAVYFSGVGRLSGVNGWKLSIVAVNVIFALAVLVATSRVQQDRSYSLSTFKREILGKKDSAAGVPTAAPPQN